MIIERGTVDDLKELGVLYDDLNDYLAQHVNYPGWIKGVYPVRKVAAKGIRALNLFVLRINGAIAGSVILNHEPEVAYNQVEWGIAIDYSSVIVVRTLVVNPQFLQHGVASALMNFARFYGIEKGMKAIRLDVSEHNTPAINLYEKLGYTRIATVDLGLDYPHLKWFYLYEMLL